MLAKQSEIYFLWDATLCNPNGDKSADNAPRFDDVDEKAIVSDVRIKRTIRDDLQYRKEDKKHLIFINNEEILKKGLTAEKRFEEIKKNVKDKNGKEAFLSCIDNRLFGGVAPNSNIQLIGTVQFGWTKTLNKTEAVLKSGTGAFATKGKDGEAKFKKTFRADNYIPYGCFGAYGTINRIQAQNCNTSEEDIKEMLDSLWFGTKFLNTRSKEGQKPRMLMRITYNENSKYFIGLLNQLVRLKNEDTSLVNSIESADIEFEKLISAINRANNEIEKVEIILDESMKKYEKELNTIEKVEIKDEFSLMT